MAVLQGGVLNLACLFPPIYIQGFVVGAGLSGVGTSVLSFVTQLRAQEGGGGGDERTAAEVAPAAFAYFSCAASVTAVCVAAFALLGRLEYSRARLAAHYAAVRRAAHHHHQGDEPGREALLPGGGGGEDEGEGEGRGGGLLSAPYEGQVPEEGEPLPACERFWPAALIPYMHPATMAAEQSAYWAADAAAETDADGLAGVGADDEGGGGGAVALLPAAVDLECGDSDALLLAPGGRHSSAGGSGGSGSGNTSQPAAPPFAPSAPMVVPGRRSSSAGGVSSASMPVAGGGPSSYGSPAAGGLSESFRCGTALRFYRSGSASALKGMLEAALTQQQVEGSGSGGGGGGGGGPLTPGGFRPGSRASQLGSSPAPLPRSVSRKGSRRATGDGVGLGGGSGAGGLDAGAARDEPRPRAKGRSPTPPHRVSKAAQSAAAAAEAARPRGAGPFVAYAVAIVVCMAGSLAVWPGVAAFICSADNPASVSPCAPRAPPYGRLSGDLFVPLMFVVYALGDLTGRVASGVGPWGRRPPAPAALLLYSLARLGVAAGLLACHVVTPAPWRLPFLLRADAWPLGLAVALGFTQGHLLSTACMHAPAVLPPGREARFGPVTGFCITAGCLAGSVASTAIVEAFTRPSFPDGLGGGGGGAGFGAGPLSMHRWL